MSTSVPSFNDFSTNLPIASINSDGGGGLAIRLGMANECQVFHGSSIWAPIQDERAVAGSTTPEQEQLNVVEGQRASAADLRGKGGLRVFYRFHGRFLEAASGRLQRPKKIS